MWLVVVPSSQNLFWLLLSTPLSSAVKQCGKTATLLARLYQIHRWDWLMIWARGTRLYQIHRWDWLMIWARGIGEWVYCLFPEWLTEQFQIVLSGELWVSSVTIGRGSERFSRLLSLHTWPQGACRENNVGFVDNFDALWGRLSLFLRDGPHPNAKDTHVLTVNIALCVHTVQHPCPQLLLVVHPRTYVTRTMWGTASSIQNSKSH